MSTLLDYDLMDIECVATTLSYRYLSNHRWLSDFVKYHENIIDKSRLSFVDSLLRSENYFYSERNVITIAAYLLGKTVISVESCDIIDDEDIYGQLYPDCQTDVDNATEVVLTNKFDGIDIIFTDSDNFVFICKMISERDYSDRMKMNQYMKSHPDFNFANYHWGKNRIHFSGYRCKCKILLPSSAAIVMSLII